MTSGPTPQAPGDRPFVRVHRPRSADGPPVLFVHGTGDRGASFARTRRRLADLAMLTIDRRGYAHSQALDPCLTVSDGAADLLAALDEPAVLIGHSFGGLLALAAAAQGPEKVLAVGVYEAPCPWLLDGSAETGPAVDAALAHPEEASERFLRAMIGDDGWDGLGPGVQAQRRREAPAVFADVSAITTLDPPPVQVADVRCPVLVGRGGMSPHRLRRAAAALAAAGGWELVEAPDDSHGVHLTNPEWFAEFVRCIYPNRAF